MGSCMLVLLTTKSFLLFKNQTENLMKMATNHNSKALVGIYMKLKTLE